MVADSFFFFLNGRNEDEELSLGTSSAAFLSINQRPGA
jgi:hypothetical protein